jgi:bifunctional non-homologous end joining protein LigD
MPRAPKPTSLETYRQKRDPERTPEPFGGPTPTSGSRFVVHQHAARNLHFDLRLELDGVLKSWAVPRGPSTHAEEKRLAVHVEDHPLEYGDFEGVIPAGNYGAGSVIVWDKGWYRSFKPEDIHEQYDRGKMEIEFFGFKLRGKWTLVRTRSQKDWLLLKKKDGAATEDEMVDRYPRSVVSGVTVEEMKDLPGKLERLSERLEQLKAPIGKVAAHTVPFMLATLGEKPFSGKDWLFEIKYDGVRVLAERDGDKVELYGRSGENISPRYPDLVQAVRALAIPRFVLDGEIVAPNESGQPSFQRLQKRMLLKRPREIEAAVRNVPVNAIFFDVLALMDHDLRRLPLLERKELLFEVVPPLGAARYSDHVLELGEAFYEAASDHHLEGIMAKRIKSAYVPRRTGDWVKLKCQKRQEFVIGGYTEPQGSRGHFGALLVGLYRGKDFVYVTNVGTGFSHDTLTEIWDMLQPLRRDKSPFTERSPKGKEYSWVEPRLVCEVRYTEWTRDGGLRHPAFLGLRDDKPPEECVFEEETEVVVADESPEPAPKSAAPRTASAPPPGAAGPMAPRHDRPRPKREFKLSNLDKVFWPEDGYTKGDLIAYYEAVSPWLLLYLRDRPLVMTRYPDGIHGKSFFQKDAPTYATHFVRTETLYAREADREIRYFIVDDIESLRYLANLATIPLHVWCSRVATIEKPDWCVIDLDPKSAPFKHVVRVAKTMRRIFDELKLPSFIKTSGASGLHLLVPMGRLYTHAEVKTFARLLALLGVDAEPDISTVARPLAAREGKVYIDWGQNGQGNTIVSPFSVRPLPGAPASCPLDWDEVNDKLDPAKFTIRTIPKRFAKRDDPLADVLTQSADMGRAIGKIEKMLGGKLA